jgi:Fur family peroxide stress response transcriptional regulator
MSTLADMTQEIMRETGFTITRHRLDFFGICPDCNTRP